jgi:hypothetical protein
VPLLEGKTSVKWRDAVFSQIRDVQMVRTEEMKLVVYDGKPGELYDLGRDPGELDNLITDPGYGSTIESLQNRIVDWERANAPGTS